jgi:Spy/CpxP family protein refolding chaperone
MQRIKIGLVLTLIYFAGLATGVVATRAVVRHMVAATVQNPERVRVLIEKRLTRRLGLDAGQQSKVDQILNHTQAEVRSLRQEFGPRFQVIMLNTQAEIAAILTPEQQERFDKFREQNRQLWQPD